MRQINTIMRRTGYVVARNETVARAGKYPFIRDSYLRTLRDYESVLRASLLPNLPQRENRHELMLELTGNPVLEAFYILHSLNASVGVEGVVCEFGVADGTNSALMANELLGKSKELWLFDSFEGLPAPTQKDVLLHDIFNLGDMKSYAGKMAHPRTKVERRLEKIKFPRKRVNIVAGFIEKVADSKWPEKVCFAYVDFDFYEPIKIALEKLDSRLSPGAHVVVDDYGHFSAGAQTAVDEFYAANKSKYDFMNPEPVTKGFVVLRKK